MVDEIIPPLLELLKELTFLEEEIFKKNHELNVEKSILKIPANQNHPKWTELMTEYKGVQGRCSIMQDMRTAKL